MGRIMDKLCRFALRKVIVRKDMLVAFIESLDGNGDGYVSLQEAGDGLRYLWKKARGKFKEPKETSPKVKVLE